MPERAGVRGLVCSSAVSRFALILLLAAGRVSRPRRARAAVLSRLLPAGDPHRGARHRPPRCRSLRNGTLHAYVGGDPFAGGRLPAHVTAVESLGGYLVARFNPAPPDAAGRCAAAARAGQSLGGPRAGRVAHPYAITPYHADYLQHWDLAQAARKAVETAPAGPPARPVAVEEVDLQSLLAAHAIGAGGTFAPPWLKDGWFHAYLLQAPAITDPAARQAVEGLYRRLVTLAYDGGGGARGARAPARPAARGRVRAPRAGLHGAARALQLGVLAGHREHRLGFPAGLQLRDLRAHRQAQGFSVERVAAGSAWPGRATAAWNPVAGFTDAPGRLLWAAIGDPGLIPAPYAAGFVPHRAVPAQVAVAGPAGIRDPRGRAAAGARHRARCCRWGRGRPRRPA